MFKDTKKTAVLFELSLFKVITFYYYCLDFFMLLLLCKRDKCITNYNNYKMITCSRVVTREALACLHDSRVVTREVRRAITLADSWLVRHRRAFTYCRFVTRDACAQGILTYRRYKHAAQIQTQIQCHFKSLWR